MGDGVQEFLTDQVVAAIESRLNLAQIVDEAFQVVIGLAPGPRSAAAIQALQQPAVEGLRSTLHQATARVIKSDGFAVTWQESVRITHATFVRLMNSNEDSKIVIDSDGIGIALGPLVDRVREDLTDRGFRFAVLIPKVDKTVTVVPGAKFEQYRGYYQIAVAVGSWLGWVVILLALGWVTGPYGRPTKMRRAMLPSKAVARE